MEKKERKQASKVNKGQKTHRIISYRWCCVENAIAAVNGFFEALEIEKIGFSQAQPLFGSFQLSQMSILRVIYEQKTKISLRTQK